MRIQKCPKPNAPKARVDFIEAKTNKRTSKRRGFRTRRSQHLVPNSKCLDVYFPRGCVTTPILTATSQTEKARKKLTITQWNNIIYSFSVTVKNDLQGLGIYTCPSSWSETVNKWKSRLQVKKLCLILRKIEEL